MRAMMDSELFLVSHINVYVIFTDEKYYKLL